MQKIKILCDNENFIVCIKEAGLVSEDNSGKNSEISLPAILSSQLGDTQLFAVHRLDKEVSGVMVYAKNKESAANISRQITEGKLEKEYLTLVSGKTEADTAELRHLLFHDRMKNKTYVVDRKRNGVKEALLRYTLISYNETNDTSILRVRLYTGRTHQIRVQLSHIGHPVCGDKKYGSRYVAKNVMLHSFYLAFYDPETSERLCFTCLPQWADGSISSELI